MRDSRAPLPPEIAARIIAGQAYNEDASVLIVPAGKAIVQTTDVLAPVVNDAKSFGRIAAANAFSDVYAMGGEPWCAMCLAFFPQYLAENDPDILVDILAGAFEVMKEACAAPAGGHTVSDEELKFGLAVTGVIDPAKVARNDGLRPGQILLLTKPLGVGILATAVKARWDYADESEAEICRWCGKLNKAGADAIRTLNLRAATDVTGFGIGGSALEMARASGVSVELFASRLPLLPRVLDYARDGLVPAGSYANEKFYASRTRWPKDIEKALVDVVFDAQTSGGLLLAVDEDQASEASAILLAAGDLAAPVGRVLPARDDGKELIIKY